MPVRVTLCVCLGVPFGQLLPLARAAEWELPDLVRETGCGGKCGLCRPYLRRMLETGETVFHEILEEVRAEPPDEERPKGSRVT